MTTGSLNVVVFEMNKAAMRGIGLNRGIGPSPGRSNHVFGFRNAQI